MKAVFVAAGLMALAGCAEQFSNGKSVYEVWVATSVVSVDGKDMRYQDTLDLSEGNATDSFALMSAENHEKHQILHKRKLTKADQLPQSGDIPVSFKFAGTDIKGRLVVPGSEDVSLGSYAIDKGVLTFCLPSPAKDDAVMEMDCHAYQPVNKN